MKINQHKLDNPAWNALNEVHGKYAISYDGLKFYNPIYCPFGGFIDKIKAVSGINDYSNLADNFFVIGEKPSFNSDLKLNNDLVCNQMVLEQQINIEKTVEIIELTSKKQKADLFDLVMLVQPGYFKPQTADLGRYFGIYKNDRLVAATGERMKMNGFTEISAVVTHREHTRKGYAKQLIKHTTDQLFMENIIPFLHVTESNIPAIKLYEKLGFTTRRKISFWHLKVI